VALDDDELPRSAPDDEKEHVMDDAKKTQEAFNQFAGKAVETLTLWADANQRVLRELLELSSVTAKESVRLYGELQQSAIEALRDSQVAAFRWQASWQDIPKDPAVWYQKAVAETVEGAQKAFRLLEGQAQAVTRAAERLQSSAEQAGKGIQETVTGVVSKTKDVYAQN
jgi:hypothetical protein